ncbi:MAG: NAD-dependent dihydropyrimidine dehydrogenase subunit PreA [bacterium]
MKKLSFKHNNVEFINPFLLASSPITRNAEMIMRGFDAGWGGAVLKTLNLCPETMNNVSQRMYGYKVKSSVLGLKNIEMISDRSIESWVDDIKLMKDKYPDRVIVASIMAEGVNSDEWQKLTEITQEAGSDIIELNLSCPNGVPERGMGSYCSELPHLCGDIVKTVKQVSKIPVWAKLSPNVTSISYLAECCLAQGADGIVAINTVKGFAGINIDTLQPNLPINGLSTYGGFSGPIVKPMALKAVSEIANDHNNCYISATGGISTWQDAIEFMLLGASSLQLCTEVMYKGYDVIQPILEGVESYLSKHNYASLESIVGLALDKVTNYGSLDNKIKYYAEISQDTCRNCGRCITACNDGGYQAISKNNSNYEIAKEKCVGCGFCQSVCSVGSIKMNLLEQAAKVIV